MPMPRQMQSLNHQNHHHLQYYYLLLLLAVLSQAVAEAASNEVVVLFSWLQTSPSPPSSFSDWNSLDSNPCNWSYIKCSSDNFVTEINIQSIQLATPFPSNLSSLRSLRTLIISGANLTGTIPLEIGNCTSLRTIDISSNSLVGSSPITISKLQNL